MTTCSKCKGQEGFFIRDEEGYERWRFCECFTQKRVLATSKITEEFKGKGFKNFVVEGRPAIVKKMQETVIDYARRFKEIRKDRRNSIALLGNPGTGKTHLLMAACNNLMHHGVPVTYFPWVETWNELKDDFDLLHKRVTLLKECELLFIDDLYKGRNEPTPLQIEQLFGIVNYRYMERKPIMLSSERSFEQILKVDEGIGSRLFQMCKDFTVEVQGDPFELNYRLVEE